jgi:hypothetical protein
VSFHFVVLDGNTSYSNLEKDQVAQQTMKNESIWRHASKDVVTSPLLSAPRTAC